MDGRSLGPPLLLDGYSVGWRITDQQPHRFEVAFAPQRTAGWAFAAAAAGWCCPRAAERVVAGRGSGEGAPPAPMGRAGGPMSPRTVLKQVLLVGALWLLGGGIGLVAGAAFVVYDLVSRPAPRDLLVIAVLLLGLVPLVVLAQGLPAADAVGPGFVEGNLVAHYLAGPASPC